jgi:hypothetical protein
MFLNRDFLKLYEELSELNEAKADTQRLIDFAGEDLANRFLAIKNRLKAPESDLYYWIKNKTPYDLSQVVTEIENTKSSSQIRKDATSGGKLVCDTAHWKVYHITTFEASKYYGRDTRWCITGINNMGDRHWKEYTSKGIKFYFLIAKDNYQARGLDSKFAIALYPNDIVEIFNQRDIRVYPTDIPYIEEISIEDVDFNNVRKIDYSETSCMRCGCIVEQPYDLFNEPYSTLLGERLCADCLERYIKEQEEYGLIELFIIIAYSNISIIDTIPFIRHLNLTQGTIDEIIQTWVKAKASGTLKNLHLEDNSVIEAEEYFIEQAPKFGFEVKDDMLK